MKKSFIIYNDNLNVLDDLTDEQAGKLFKAIKLYQTEGKIELDGLLKAIFTPFKTVFDMNDEKYKKVCERNRINGCKGGRPITQNNPNNPVGFLETQTNPNNLDNDNDNDNEINIYKEESKQVIEYLNNKTNYNYKFVDKNIKLVSNRLKEYSKEELLAMIDYKCSEWLQDERFKKYLRPATLFNASKCADYIAQLQTNSLKNNLRSKIRGNL